MTNLLRKLLSMRAWKALLFDTGGPLLKLYVNCKRPITFVDVGAHNGSFAALVFKHWSVKSGLLIEPLPDQAEQLKKRFFGSSVSVIHGAAGEEDGSTSLNVYGFAETSSVLHIKQGIAELDGYDTSPQSRLTCPQHRLDSLTEKFDHIDLLKIDVQGSEHLVLAGAIATLEKTSVVWIEVSFKPLYEGSCVFSDIYSSLNARGFKLKELVPGFRSQGGELVQADALFQRP